MTVDEASDEAVISLRSTVPINCLPQFKDACSLTLQVAHDQRYTTKRCVGQFYLFKLFFFFFFFLLFSVLPATIQLYIAGLPSMCWGTLGTELGAGVFPMFQTFFTPLLLPGFEPATAQPQGVVPAP